MCSQRPSARRSRGSGKRGQFIFTLVVHLSSGGGSGRVVCSVLFGFLKVSSNSYISTLHSPTYCTSSILSHDSSKSDRFCSWIHVWRTNGFSISQDLATIRSESLWPMWGLTSYVIGRRCYLIRLAAIEAHIKSSHFELIKSSQCHIYHEMIVSLISSV